MRKRVDRYPTRVKIAMALVLGAALMLSARASAVDQVEGPRPVVVIDPGHGGANLGAAGRSVREKALTLAVAQRLRQLLLGRGYRVVLTRHDDRYLTLRERVRRANAVEPQVFVSLHANASADHSQRGVETYVLDRGVAEVEARRMARLAGGPVAGVLADVRAAHLLRESMRLGRAIQESLVSLRGAVDRGLRQSDFDVLSGVAAPAVLVEVGFIDHVVEGPLLSEPAVQAQVAEALSSGIDQFLRAGEGTAGDGPTQGERPPRRQSPSLNMAQAR